MGDPSEVTTESTPDAPLGATCRWCGVPVEVREGEWAHVPLPPGGLRFWCFGDRVEPVPTKDCGCGMGDGCQFDDYRREVPMSHPDVEVPATVHTRLDPALWEWDEDVAHCRVYGAEAEGTTTVRVVHQANGSVTLSVRHLAASMRLTFTPDDAATLGLVVTPTP